MRGCTLFAFGFAIALLAACAAGDSRSREPSRAAEEVPLCGSLDTLAPLPDAACGDELADYEAALWDRIDEPAGRALVRVELDEQARIRALCVGPGPGHGPGSARRALAKEVAALRAVPPGPACAAGKRLDFNRYEAKWAEIREREARCGEQTRVTRETHPGTEIRDRETGGDYGVYDREYERCMDYQADWIALDAPGSTKPAIWAKPEIPEPSGPDAYETARRCTRLSRVFEKRAACIEADGWERLDPRP